MVQLTQPICSILLFLETTMDLSLLLLFSYHTPSLSAIRSEKSFEAFCYLFSLCPHLQYFKRETNIAPSPDSSCCCFIAPDMEKGEGPCWIIIVFSPFLTRLYTRHIEVYCDWWQSICSKSSNNCALTLKKHIFQ